LTDLSGNAIRLADLRGRPVWISFWASWCPPWPAETPVLRDLYAAHKASGLAMVAISVQETTADDVRAYAQKYGLEFTIGFDATPPSSRPIRRTACRRTSSSTATE